MVTQKTLKFFLRIIPLMFVGLFSFGQTYILTGTVINENNIRLENANIIAKPIQLGKSLKFSLTDKKGFFKIKLDKFIKYELGVSYVGYYTNKIIIEEKDDDFEIEIKLKENPGFLEEIVINYKPPITIKKDTIVYRVDEFISGNERKLREVLKKLPGVEVDREGNVKVQGKTVTKVLVEDKTFFTGDSKLAVNNIPADAVDKVEVLDNYSEIAMLKGLEDSDDMAMNIKLKKDKKKFAFGDLEAGGGVEDRYVVHPNLFYYSPKTNLNFIGDLNNMGIKSFTFKDYLDFEGGFSKFMDNAGGYLALANDDFAQYLRTNEFISNINKFGALNFRQSLSSSTDINSYLIVSDTDTQTLNNTLNSYQFMDDQFLENRSSENYISNFFTIGKLSLDYKPSFGEELSLNTSLKATKGNSLGQIITQSPSRGNQIGTAIDNDELSFRQGVNYSLEISKVHTATLESTYSFEDTTPYAQWLTNRQILQGLIPLVDSEEYKIQQDKSMQSQSFSVFLKDYWVINRFNHMYTAVGFNLNFNEFYSRDLQILDDGSINNFGSAGFGNELSHRFTNSFVGLEYKFQIGIATFRPMLYYHHNTWLTQQETRNIFKTNLLLPKFTAKIEFNNSEKINFRYGLSPQFPSMERLATGFILSDFNRVYRGNDNLENTLAHSASLTYYKFSLFRNLNLNFGANYSKHVKTLKNVVELDGIESFSTPIIFSRPEELFGLNGRISKKVRKVRFNLEGGYNYSDFYQLLNGTETLNVSKTYRTGAGFETFFKNWPNLEFEYSKDFSDYSSFAGDNKFDNDIVSAYLEHRFLKDFVIKADYTFESYKNNTQKITNTFDIANASLYYQKEDSPWGFEISGTNLFDIEFRQRNSFNNFLISDSRTFIMPRIVMFKLSYKL